MRPTVNLETTIPSYLTVRPSRDLVTAARQEITRVWWENRRHNYDCVLSQVVLDVCLSCHLHPRRTHGETMNTEPDPILQEVHAAKAAVAASYGHDLKKMFADLMRRQGQDGRQVISLPPRKISAA